MVEVHPRQIVGQWQKGYALDVHTLSSEMIGHNEYGHPQFSTTRSDLGELLFALKNRGKTSVVGEIVAAATAFLKVWRPPVDLIVPVAPSTRRALQPVILLARNLSSELGIPLAECIRKVKETPQLKNIYGLDERMKLLEGAFEVDPKATRGKTILLFDDL